MRQPFCIRFHNGCRMVSLLLTRNSAAGRICGRGRFGQVTLGPARGFLGVHDRRDLGGNLRLDVVGRSAPAQSIKDASARFARAASIRPHGRSGHRRQNCPDSWITLKEAPCGSASMAKRPTADPLPVQSHWHRAGWQCRQWRRSPRPQYMPPSAAACRPASCRPSGTSRLSTGHPA